jgi:hypothetical protein
MVRIAPVKRLRIELGLSRVEFAERFHIRLAHCAIGSSGATSRTKPASLSQGDRGRCRLRGAGARCGVRLAAEGPI